jgi:hypothetical protein
MLDWETTILTLLREKRVMSKRVVFVSASWTSFYGPVDIRILVYILTLNDCTERDSPRDQLVVTVFLIIVIGLLIGAAVKTRMEQIGFDRNAVWSSSRSWWEVNEPLSMNYLLEFSLSNLDAL